MRRVLAFASMISICGCAGGAGESGDERSSSPDGGALVADRMPVYTSDDRLERVDDWERWTFLGTSLDLTYTEAVGGQHAFAVVYMEPTAFDHFRETGEFREGTMTALVVYGAASGAPPALAGQFPGAQIAFEMSVKDSSRGAGVPWSYYSFQGDSAAPHPPASCFDCHHEHAETDHVFTQFYPGLP